MEYFGYIRGSFVAEDPYWDPYGDSIHVEDSPDHCESNRNDEYLDFLDE